MNNKESNPLFSILIVTYNSNRFIKETIESCLNQDFKSFEIIISDDNSTDNTWEIIDKINDNKLYKFKQNTNLGEYPNRNFCVKQAKGKYLIFIDGEDLLYPNALNFISYFIDKNRDAAIFLAKEWNEKIIYPKILTKEMFLKLEYLDEGICALNFTQIIINREIILRLGAFDNIKDIKIGDVYLQYLICTQFDSVLIPNAFSWWRRRKGQASEKLLNNYGLYFTELNKFKYNFLLKNKKVFSKDEYKRAVINYFGVFFRFLIKNILRLRFIKVYNYLEKNKSCIRFVWTIPFKNKNIYLSNFSGEEPI